MGLIGDLLSAATSGGNAPAAAPADVHTGLLQHVLNMATDSQSGGLGGLIQKLSSGGLSSAVNSWVGNGPNQAVSSQQIESALGSDQINQLAAKFGIPASQVSSHLSQILPEVINHLTPNGNVPHQSAVQSAIGMLAGKLFR